MNLVLLLRNKTGGAVATTTFNFYYTTIAAVFSAGITRMNAAAMNLRNAKTGTLTGTWIPATDSLGSYARFDWELLTGDFVIYKVYAQEILSTTRTPLSVCCGGYVQGQVLNIGLLGGALNVTATEVAAMLAAAFENMVIAQCGATTYRPTPFSMVAAGRTKVWYANAPVFAAGPYSYGGTAWGVADFTQQPSTPDLNASQLLNINLQSGIAPQWNLPGVQTLPDMDIAINNGSAIFSVMSQAFTFPEG